MFILDFEKPIIELRKKIDELKRILDKEEYSISDEVKHLEYKVTQLEKETYSKLDPWHKTQLARHPQRPYTLDFVEICTTEFTELHGDRHYADDAAIVGGFCKIDGQSFMLIGHQKGRTTQEKIKRNFAMPKPEGYRKALRLMKLAEKFNLPILTLIDTPGAYPGIGAEERGQSEAIAVNLREMAALKVPVITCVLGEGGSGGALALGVANRILMLEHAIYSVISPEGCAGILWGDGKKAKDAANALKYTADELIKYGIIDEIIPEPDGAHLKPEQAMNSIKTAVLSQLRELEKLNPDELVEQRFDRFRKIGVFAEA